MQRISPFHMQICLQLALHSKNVLEYRLTAQFQFQVSFLLEYLVLTWPIGPVFCV